MGVGSTEGSKLWNTCIDHGLLCSWKRHVRTRDGNFVGSEIGLGDVAQLNA